jgi:hypothetical protein
MYYLFRLPAVRTNYSIESLKQCFFKKSKSKKYNYLDTKQVSPRQNHCQTIHQTSEKEDGGDTVKCSTCNVYPEMSTPEKDNLNEYKYVFDLNHLPTFDDNTGEFIWSKTDESNWKTARNSLFKSEEICNTGNVSLNHGGLFSLTSSFVNNKDEMLDYKKWDEFKKENNTGTFIEELNHILKDFDNLTTINK